MHAMLLSRLKQGLGRLDGLLDGSNSMWPLGEPEWRFPVAMLCSSCNRLPFSNDEPSGVHNSAFCLRKAPAPA
jgi:hypothetical protein